MMELQKANPHLLPLDPYQRVNGPVLLAEDANGNAVGVAIGRRTVEAFMYLDPKLSNYQKAKTTRALAENGFPLMGEAGYCEVHLFTDIEGFETLMAKLPNAHTDPRKHVWVDVSGRT